MKKKILVSFVLGFRWIAASALALERLCPHHHSSSSSLTSSSLNRPIRQRQPRRTLLVLASISSTGAADVSTFPPNNSPEEASVRIDVEDDDRNIGTGFSKVKWKKKRYLLLRDVMDLIDQGKYNKAARKAREMIRRMTSLYEQTLQPDCLPTTQAYNVWIHALAKSSRNNNDNNADEAGRDAEAVLRELQRQSAKLSSTAADVMRLRLRPNVITYTSVMDAYASRGQAEDAERILMELLEACDRRPTERDLRLTSVTVDTILNAWASRKTWEAAERAEEILRRLELLVEDEASHAAASRTLVVRPTAHSYAAVIHAWASCGGGTDAARRAQRILTTLVEGTRSVKVVPDTVVFNAAMHAWANSGDEKAGEKASDILKQMLELSSSSATTPIDCQPDIVSYNTVLSAWSHASGHPQAGTRAEKILQNMIVACRRADPDSAVVAPNTVSYNSVLHAWSQSPLDGAAERAESVLEFMLAVAQQRRQRKDVDSAFRDVSPDAYSFTSVLNAVAKSRDPDKAVRAQKWLHRLVDGHKSTKRPELHPTQVPFNTVINACAFSAYNASDPQRMQAVEVAAQTLAEMRSEGIDPDEVTYYNMIKCAGNLLSNSRRKRHEMVLPLFESCCQDGLLTETTWNQVCRAVNSQVLQEFFRLSPSEQKYAALPRQWKRNISAAARKSRNRSKISSALTAPALPHSPGKRYKARSVPESSYQSGRDL